MTKAQVLYAAVFFALSVSFGFKTIHSFSGISSHKNLSPRSSSVDSVVSERQDWEVLYDSLNLEKEGLSQKAFQYAWFGFHKMKLGNPILAIADFSQSSCKKRLYVIDLIRKKLLYNTYVAHGRNSGNEYAQKFSNDNSSYQSSLGFYKTLGTYQGKHGLSLRLEGLEKGINDRAFERAIVMHGADYVSEAFIKNTGRLGRSLGCPAVSISDSKKLISMLYNGAGLFIYSLDKNYIQSSRLLSGLAEGQALGAPRLYTSSK